MRREYPVLSNLDLARMLGRSVKSVVSKAHHLGLKKSSERLRDMGKERNWPEIVFYLSDELSNDGNEGKEEGLKRAEASKGIAGIRRISSVNGKSATIACVNA